MDILKQIIFTLNSIEVKGKDNLDKLLGCILLLESIVNAPAETDNKEGNSDG